MENTQAQLINADCLEAMRLLPDQSVDLILCDLPYGTTQNKWDVVIDLDALWKQYRRLARGAVVLTASQPFATDLIAKGRDWFRYDLIWAKNKASGHLNAKRRPMVGHESILVFSEKTTTYNPQKSAGHAPANYAKRIGLTPSYGSSKMTVYEGGNTDRYPTSVLHFPVLNNDSPERFHPTQKPVALMEYLIRTYSNEGDLVLDNCMGSGTTGLAAANSRRRFLGIEKDEGFFQVACRRISDALGKPPKTLTSTSSPAPVEAEPTLFSFIAA